MPKSVQISVEAVGFQQSLEKQIYGATKGQGIKIPVNDKSFNQAFTGMTANVRRFEQSLDISNRRVIAFGTSASIVYGLARGFNELVSATVSVEKSMTAINALFGLSARNLDSFSKSLFNVARQTGSAFDDVAKTAEEFSRQGLGVEETLKRTRDAMILVRLTGLDTAKAVSTLTAAVNTFAKAGEDSTSILNKVVAADQRFAVSARDIAEAFERVGSVVDDAGVSIDQFIGLVTAAKQITSRDGAVIGNSLKTILTRLERSTTIDDLEALGIAVRDAAGNAKPALSVFNELAKSYGTLGREQQQLVAQLGGGVFQINQFKALLLDLGKANGVAAQATKVSVGATNEALIRNAALNQTLATSFQNLRSNAQEAAAIAGNLALKPVIGRGLDFGNVLKSLFGNAKSTGDTKAAEDFGAYLGESILKGLGNLLAGPGLVFGLKAVVGVLNRTVPELLGDVKSSARLFNTGINSSTIGGSINRALTGNTEVEAVSRTNALLAQGTKEEQARYAAATAVAEQEAIILGIIERQVALLAGAGAVASAPAITSLRGRRRTPFGAGGYLPIGAESSAIAQGIGGAPSNARPVYLGGFRRPDGQGIVANTSEFIVPGAAGGYPAIYNREMIQKVGLPPGSTPVAAAGYVPNAADSWLGGTKWTQPANTAYEAAILRAQQAENAVENTWNSIVSRFSSTILKSAATLNANASIAGLGGVLPYGPPSPSARMLSVRNAPIFDHTAGGPGETTEAYRARIQSQFGIDPSHDPTPFGPIQPSAAQLEERRLQDIDLAKDAAIARARRDQQTIANLQRRERLASRVNNALLIGSFGAAFLPQGTSGQATGQLSGGVSGALTGGAIGATVGGVVGPVGGLIGAGVGALGGGIRGFIDRATKSFEEVAAEIEKDNEKLKGQMEAVSKAFSLQEQIVEGGERGLSHAQLNRMRRELGGDIAKITDPEVRRLVLSGSAADQQKAVQMLSDRAAQDATKQAIRLSFTKGVTEGDRSPGSVGNTANALQASYIGLSNAELAKIARDIRNPGNAAITGLTSGGGPGILGRIGLLMQAGGGIGGGIGSALFNRSAAGAGTFTQDAVIKAINAEIQRRADEAGAEAARAASNGPRPISRVESLALASRLGVAGQIAQVRAGGALQIAQAKQGFSLETPGLTEMERARLAGQYGRENIVSQFAATRASTLAAGKSALIQSLGEAGVRDRGLIEGRLASATGKDDLISLQRDLTSLLAEKAPAGTLAKTQDAIKDLIDRLTVLNATEEESIKVNDTTNGLMRENILSQKSLDSVQKNLRRDLSVSAGAQTTQDQAIINLAKEGNPFVTGDALAGAQIGQANRLGRGGLSKGSFDLGFKAQFSAAKKEALNFAAVGEQVANSLSNNFSQAFGDFVTGTKRAKDAFRDFIVSVLAESARVFATKAIVSLLGSFFGGLGASSSSGAVGQGLFLAPGQSATGGFIGRATGGSIPTMLTGGEFVYPPAQAARIGGRMLKAVNSGIVRTFAPGGLVRGGSGVADDVFQPLAAGSFVVRKAMVERYGASNLASLSIGGYPDMDTSAATTLRMAAGGPVASAMSAPTPVTVNSGGGGGVFTIGVTINDNSTVTQSSASNGQGSNLNDKQFGDTLARRIKQLTIQTIEEQKRIGGMLRPQSNLYPS